MQLIYTVKISNTVHVFRSVFDHSLSHVVILCTIDDGSLKPSPSHRNNKRIKCFQHSFIPSVVFETNSGVSQLVLAC